MHLSNASSVKGTDVKPSLNTRQAWPCQTTFAIQSNHLVANLINHPTRDNLQLLSSIATLHSSFPISSLDLSRHEKAVDMYVKNKNDTEAARHLSQVSQELLSKINNS